MTEPAQDSKPMVAAGSLCFGKVMICITEDWFALSHFQPLIRAVRALAREVVVVTRSSGRLRDIEALGVRAVDFNFHRSSTNPVREVATVFALRRLITQERPDALHLVALKPIVLGSYANSGLAPLPTMLHLTGLGLIAVSSKSLRGLVRAQAFRTIRRAIVLPSTHLLVENEDDLELLRRGHVVTATRWSLLGGAGIDPNAFPALPPPENTVPVAAHVGRMIESKGVDTLLAAAQLLRERGVALQLDLYGKVDEGNPDALSAGGLGDGATADLARWHGHLDDVGAIWRKTDIYVLASRGGEGLPRALLEAAASARPLVVTDVPGCRQFVRDGVEGLVVPPGNPAALADALARLAADPDLRRRMGTAARARLLETGTAAQVMAEIDAAYRALSARCLALKPN